MKRSTLGWWSFILFLVEVVITSVGLNEKFMFVGSTLEDKYKLLCVGIYIISMLVLTCHGIAASDDSESTKKSKYLYIFGKEYMNPLYTWHFIIFSAFSFYLSAWPWVFAGLYLFIMTNVRRNRQNEYAEAFELERTKEAARQYQTVVLDNDHEGPF